MKKLLSYLSLILLSFCLLSTETLSKQTSTRLIENDNFLTDSQRSSIIKDIRKFEKTTSDNPQFVVIFKNEVSDIKEFSNLKFKEIGIGHKDKNNGILLVITSNKVRLEVGYGLEQYITDGIASSLIEDNRKYVENKEYDIFLHNILKGIHDRIGLDVTTSEINILPFLIIFVIAIIVLLISLKSTKKENDELSMSSKNDDSEDAVKIYQSYSKKSSYIPRHTNRTYSYETKKDYSKSSDDNFIEKAALAAVIYNSLTDSSSSSYDSSSSSDSSSSDSWSSSSDSSFGGGDSGGGGWD